MSDEEKKDLLKKLEYCEQEYEQNGYLSVGKFKAIKQAIELIEKQSKEIEELKEDNKHQWEERCKLTFELENSTSNDKIKAKVKEIKDRPVKDEFITASQGKLNAIIDMESLLEKE